MKIPHKQYVIITAIVAIVLLGAGGYLYVRSSSPAAPKADKETVFEDEPNAIPTVSVPVTIEIDGKTEATLTITGFPQGTKAIEYELTYDTASGSVEGVFGSIKIESGKPSATEKLTFGTCSSGVCKYHSIKGKVKGTFKFSGAFGTQLLEREFSL